MKEKKIKTIIISSIVLLEVGQIPTDSCFLKARLNWTWLNYIKQASVLHTQVSKADVEIQKFGVNKNRP